MKKTLWLATMAAFVFVLGVYPGHAQPMGLGMMGSTYGTPPDEDWDYCHYCGNYPGPGYGMGPGRMGYGYGMGPWMMHRGYGMMGPGYGYGMGPWMMHRGYGMMGPGYGYDMGPGMMGYGYGMGPWMMHRGYGMMGPGHGCGMGPGMMGYGYGMGPWMMHRGYGMMGPGYGYGYEPRYGYGRAYRQPVKPLDENQVKQEVENYLKSTRNPNLKMGKIEERAQDYEVDIETKDGALVNKLLVDKDTGWMRSVY